MIDGERGLALIEQIAVLRSAGLLDSDTVTTQLLGSVFTEALRAGKPPRQVIVDIWDALPSDEEWEPVIREKFEEAIEELEARGL